MVTGVASARSVPTQLAGFGVTLLFLLFLGTALAGLPASAAELAHLCDAPACGEAPSMEASTSVTPGGALLCLHEASCAGAAAHGFSGAIGLAVAVSSIGLALRVASTSRRRSRQHGTLHLPGFVCQLFRPPRFA